MTYPAEVLVDTPIVYWEFEDASGSTATDSSGNSLPGTLTGSVTPGFGQAALFSGLGTSVGLSGGGGSYIYRTHETVWDFGAGDFAFEFLIKDNNSLSNYAELFAIDNSASGNGLILYLNQTTGTLRLWCGGSVANGTINIMDNQPHIITFSRDSGVVEAYVDGLLDLSATLSGTLITGQDLRVGIGSGAYPSLIGKIQHFSLYDHALSIGRVNDHASALGLWVESGLPNQRAEGYIYENVGLHVVNTQEAQAQIYENVGFLIVDTKEAYGEIFENVGVTNPNPGDADGYIYEDTTIFVPSYWGQLI